MNDMIIAGWFFSLCLFVILLRRIEKLEDCERTRRAMLFTTQQSHTPRQPHEDDAEGKTSEES